MDKEDKLAQYFNTPSPWQPGIKRLRQLLSTTELVEDWKWQFPTYTLNKKNVMGIASHKHHFGIWFFQGVFLKDTQNILTNAQEGKTKAMRSLKFTSLDQLNEEIILEYTLEAIQNSKDGKQIKPERNTKELIIPIELETAFNKDSELKHHFKRLSLSKQREYADHIGSAKQEATRLRRLDKCMLMIYEGKGLHDKYKNC